MSPSAIQVSWAFLAWKVERVKQSGIGKKRENEAEGPKKFSGFKRAPWLGLLDAISLAEESNRDDSWSFNDFAGLKANEKTTDYFLETAGTIQPTTVFSARGPKRNIPARATTKVPAIRHPISVVDWGPVIHTIANGVR